jgi:hypothetical protein
LADRMITAPVIPPARIMLYGCGRDPRGDA